MMLLLVSTLNVIVQAHLGSQEAHVCEQGRCHDEETPTSVQDLTSSFGGKTIEHQK